MFSNFIKFFKIYFLVALTVFALSANIALAGDKAREGLNQAANQGYTGGQGTQGVNDGIIQSIPGAIGKVIGVALSFVGLAFFLLMIYGGFRWMFARGNDQEVAKAKEIITAAVIGIVIVLSAYAITAFIGNVLVANDPGI